MDALIQTFQDSALAASGLNRSTVLKLYVRDYDANLFNSSFESAIVSRG